MSQKENVKELMFDPNNFHSKNSCPVSALMSSMLINFKREREREINSQAGCVRIKFLIWELLEISFFSLMLDLKSLVGFTCQRQDVHKPPPRLLTMLLVIFKRIRLHSDIQMFFFIENFFFFFFSLKLQKISTWIKRARKKF